MIGLAGAHRTGKTTLAREFAKKHGWHFAETSVSSIITELGYDPAQKFDFHTRLIVQEHILIRLNKFYAGLPPNNVITDRTPLDMMAYTLAEAIGDAVSQEDQERLKRYMNQCYESLNRHFSEIVVVQPGIPLIHEKGKAVVNEAYIEHLNALINGLCSDPRMKTIHFYIPRERVELDRRIKSIEYAQQRSLERIVMEAAEAQSRHFH